MVSHSGLSPLSQTRKRSINSFNLASLSSLQVIAGPQRLAGCKTHSLAALVKRKHHPGPLLVSPRVCFTRRHSRCSPSSSARSSASSHLFSRLVRSRSQTQISHRSLPWSVSTPFPLALLSSSVPPGLYGFDVRGPSAFPKFRTHYWASVLNVLRRKVGAEVIVTGVPGYVLFFAPFLHSSPSVAPVPSLLAQRAWTSSSRSAPEAVLSTLSHTPWVASIAATSSHIYAPQNTSQYP